MPAAGADKSAPAAAAPADKATAPVKPEPKAEPKAEPKDAPKPDPKPAPKPASKSEPKPAAPAVDDGPGYKVSQFVLSYSQEHPQHPAISRPARRRCGGPRAPGGLKGRGATDILRRRHSSYQRVYRGSLQP